ncbi:hypothetical protein Vsou_16080 [Vulcanisaeta souniana JCM 11219]|uniref:Uncharacterized protein n=1 Tax=Vulcanisaeta souniana JCM 11219 TaxID=1293586 RepID=A0ABN6SRQ1_9CREN|nr:hypothetical protein Vsou_16080 [Vulcanisaeta souniana JCM 11219]
MSIFFINGSDHDLVIGNCGRVRNEGNDIY